MNSEWQSFQPQTQQELKNTMNAMQPPQSAPEIKAGLETTEKGGVRQSIRNCLTVFQRSSLSERVRPFAKTLGLFQLTGAARPLSFFMVSH